MSHEMTANEIVERIMTHHWDLTACQCWICEAGRALGFSAREEYLEHKSTIKIAHVAVPTDQRGSILGTVFLLLWTAFLAFNIAAFLTRHNLSALEIALETVGLR